MPVAIDRQGRAAIVRIDNPPVNAIGRAERQGLLDAIEALSAEPDLDRIVLTGAGDNFAAGADAREFDGPALEPHLPDVIARMEAMTVPWIAAVMGAALGGGGELLLGCRWRIATAGASIGFPEVTLGVVPGAGGTQRLPRLIGLAPALEMIATGRPVSGKEATTRGLVDQLAEDPLAAALALDLGALSARRPLSAVPAPKPDEAAVTAARKQAETRMRGQLAPLEAVVLVGLGAVMPFDQAIREERETFLRLRQSDQARALRHIFFAERGARVPDRLRAVEPVEVRQVVVVGGGTMGAAIAYALDQAGLGATIVEQDADAVARAEGNLGKLIDGAVKRGLYGADEADARRKRIGVQAGYDGLPPVELAIEAAFESLEVKRAVFAQLDAALPTGAILATNTSYLDVNEIAAAVGEPSRVLGLHFFSPAHIMKLLEIVRTDSSSDRALATGFALARRLRKIPVLAGVCDGFIGNRILARYREAADMVLMDGATPWEIDAAMMAFGYPMGPYAAQDLSGLDIAHANRQRQAPTRDPNRRYIPIADRMVEEGRLGRKTGAGWYRYPGGEGPVEDPTVEDLVCEEARRAGVARREFSAEEIQARLVAAMVNEAAAILEEGIAERAEDIDLVQVHGYGFPRWRGGLMHYADQVGLPAILADIHRFAEADPVVWTPTPLLVRLAEAGKGFADPS